MSVYGIAFGILKPMLLWLVVVVVIVIPKKCCQEEEERSIFALVSGSPPIRTRSRFFCSCVCCISFLFATSPLLVVKQQVLVEEGGLSVKLDAD